MKHRVGMLGGSGHTPCRTVMQNRRSHILRFSQRGLDFESTWIAALSFLDGVPHTRSSRKFAIMVFALAG